MSTSGHQYVEDSLKDFRERRFKNHVATVTYFKNEDGTKGITHIRWAIPDSSIDGITYLIYRNALTVLGDLGSAVYAWSSNLDLSFLAGCHWQYMLGKLETVERGRQDGEVWDSEVAIKSFKEEILRQARDEYFLTDCDRLGLDEDTIWENIGPFRQEEEFLKIIRHLGLHRWEDEIFNEQEWNRYLYEEDKGNDLNECFGTVGKVPSIRVLAHNLGLKMAREQLEAAENITADSKTN